MAASFATLPAELYRHIAEHLPHESQKSTRFVSRALNDACRPEVFKHIVVYADEESFAKARAVADDEQLRFHVRTIEYSGKMVFFRHTWVEDFYEWIDDGVMRGDVTWTRQCPAYGAHDHHRSPLQERPFDDTEWLEHHDNYSDFVASQGRALRDQQDYELFRHVMARCEKVDGLLFDAGWSHERPGPGDPIFDKTLMGRTPYGGYKRHTRQMLVLLAAAADQLPGLKSFAALGIDHSSLHHVEDSRIFQAWNRLQNLTVHFKDADPDVAPICCHLKSWATFRDLLDRITSLKSLSLEMWAPTCCLEQIFTPLYKKALEYKDAPDSGFKELSEDEMTAVKKPAHYPALRYLYLSGPDGTSQQWHALLKGIHDAGHLQAVSLPGCAVVTGFDGSCAIATNKLTTRGHAYTWITGIDPSPPSFALVHHTCRQFLDPGWTIEVPDVLHHEAAEGFSASEDAMDQEDEDDLDIEDDVGDGLEDDVDDEGDSGSDYEDSNADSDG